MDGSLDDYAARNKAKSARGGGRSRGGGRGGRRGAGGATKGQERFSPYGGGRGGGRGGRGGGGGGSRILVTGLDRRVVDLDIQELFGSIGPVKIARVNFNQAGQSQGTADVLYARAADAEIAYNKYNGVLLDNRPMKIFVVTEPKREPATARVKGVKNDPPAKKDKKEKKKAEKPKKEPKKPLTSEDLDADMDAFFKSAPAEDDAGNGDADAPAEAPATEAAAEATDGAADAAAATEEAVAAEAEA